jgi:hypothetical protein
MQQSYKCCCRTTIPSGIGPLRCICALLMAVATFGRRAFALQETAAQVGAFAEALCHVRLRTGPCRILVTCEPTGGCRRRRERVGGAVAFPPSVLPLSFYRSEVALSVSAEGAASRPHAKAMTAMRAPVRSG